MGKINTGGGFKPKSTDTTRETNMKRAVKKARSEGGEVVVINAKTGKHQILKSIHLNSNNRLSKSTEDRQEGKPVKKIKASIAARGRMSDSRGKGGTEHAKSLHSALDSGAKAALIKKQRKAKK